MVFFTTKQKEAKRDIHEKKYDMPPHERKALINLEFEQEDWELLEEIFGSLDTANAVSEIIRKAPLEIQIIFIQLINNILKEKQK